MYKQKILYNLYNTKEKYGDCEDLPSKYNTN